MVSLEATFIRLGQASRRPDGRGPMAAALSPMRNCLRGDTVRLGTDALDGLRAPLGLVLDSARWFTAACGLEYAKYFEETYRQRATALGTGVVPFADLWLMAQRRAVRPAAHAPRARRARACGSAGVAITWTCRLTPGGSSSEQPSLRERVTSEFPAQPLPWAMAVHHSPDLMIAGAEAASGGKLTWVLGEIHPSIVTMRYATWRGIS